MTTKKCTCKGGKTDPKCPVCNAKGDINLDSFHRLNPEADPRKKLAQLKLAFPANLLQRASSGLQSGMGAIKNSWNGLSPEMRSGLTNMGKNALVPAAAGALVGGLGADPGQGMSGALKGGLLGGAMGAGVAGVDHFTQPPAQKVGMYYEFGKNAALAAFSI